MLQKCSFIQDPRVSKESQKGPKPLVYDLQRNRRMASWVLLFFLQLSFFFFQAVSVDLCRRQLSGLLEFCTSLYGVIMLAPGGEKVYCRLLCAWSTKVSVQ